MNAECFIDDGYTALFAAWAGSLFAFAYCPGTDIDTMKLSPAPSFAAAFLICPIHRHNTDDVMLCLGNAFNFCVYCVFSALSSDLNRHGIMLLVPKLYMPLKSLGINRSNGGSNGYEPKTTKKKFLHPATVKKVGHLGEAEVSLVGQPNDFLWTYSYTLGGPFRLTSASPKWPTIFTVC
jgi:hypothetical protein